MLAGPIEHEQHLLAMTRSRGLGKVLKRGAEGEARHRGVKLIVRAMVGVRHVPRAFSVASTAMPREDLDVPLRIPSPATRLPGGPGFAQKLAPTPIPEKVNASNMARPCGQ